MAESKAREATEMRKQVALEMARRQKMAKDEQLRKLAQQARMERGGPLAAATGLAGRDTAAVGAPPPAAGGGGYPGPPPAGAGGGRLPGGGSSSEDEDERRRAHGGSRRDNRSGGRGDEYDDDRGRGRGGGGGRDEYEETAEVRVVSFLLVGSGGWRGRLDAGFGVSAQAVACEPAVSVRVLLQWFC